MNFFFFTPQTTAYPEQGVVAQNQPLIQCTFNVTIGFITTPKSADSMYSVTILNGTTNGELLQVSTLHHILHYVLN